MKKIHTPISSAIGRMPISRLIQIDWRVVLASIVDVGGQHGIGPPAVRSDRRWWR
jgi:hypothetical protein